MDISSSLVPQLVLVFATVFVNSAPPAYPTFNFTMNTVPEYPKEGDCAGRCGSAPVKPTAIPQITNRNKDMDDCPIQTQIRINGICQCPSDYSKRVGSFCCAHDFDVVQNCKCPYGYVFKRNTRELCYKINMREYTILVNGVSMCQDENLKTKDGRNCCIMNEKSKRLCHCPKGKTYDHVANKCSKSCKFTF